MAYTKRILKYLKPYKFLAIIGPLFMVLEVIMDLYQPKIMQNMIDVGIANSDFNYVLRSGILMVVISVIGLIGGVLCIKYSTTAAINASTDLRKDLYGKIQGFSGGNIDKFSSGKLITILTTDVSNVQMAIMMMLRTMVRSPLLFIGSIVMVFINSYKLSPVLLGVIPILVVALIIIGKKASMLFRKVQESLDGVNTTMQENLSGVRVVKAFVREEYEINKFDKVNEDLTKVNTAAVQSISILLPVIMLVVNLGIVAALWLGAINVNNGTIQVGQIIAFLNYLLQLLMALTMIAMIFIHIARSVPSVERIMKVLDTEPEIIDSENAKQVDNFNGDVEFQDVSFSYNDDGEMVLKHISFKANQGEKIGIIGSTGSGKSTLVKLIPRLYDVDEGKILIDGMDIRDLTISSLRSAIGMATQKPLLFSGTIESNIKYGKEDAALKEMRRAAESACAMEFLSTFEQGFQYELTQMATNLSGGQKQRLAITRALVRKPKILILDDSTSALDARSEGIIQEALEKEFNDTTTFIIALKISSIIDAERILVLDEGELVGQGIHSELLKNCNIYKEIYLSQGGKEVAHED